MTMERITVSLPSELVAKARAAVEAGEAASVSAYVASALSRRRSRQQFVDEVNAELGPATEEEKARTDALLALPAGTIIDISRLLEQDR